MKLGTGQRFAAYRSLLGDRFDGRVLPGEFANPNPPPFFRDVVSCPHSVVTAHLVDQAGHPTLQARDEILKFLAERLRSRSGALCVFAVPGVCCWLMMASPCGHRPLRWPRQAMPGRQAHLP